MKNVFTLHNSAFSLIEVALALGVSAFCLTALLALLPLGLQNSQTASEQTTANGLLSAVAGDLRAAPAADGAVSTQFRIPLPSNPVKDSTPIQLYLNSAGQVVKSGAPGSRYRLTVTFLPNGGNEKTATLANLELSWPAMADAANASGRTSAFLALDRN